jgi:hypothetical protein
MAALGCQAGIEGANVAVTFFQDVVRYVLLSHYKRVSEEAQRQRGGLPRSSGPQLGTVGGMQQEIDGEIFGQPSQTVVP